MISFPNPFKTRRNANAAHSLYSTTILAARDPWIFNDCGVPDTPEGRFEVLMLMAFLVLNRLKGIDSADDVAQAYFDIMFEDIDANLREMGVGETTLAKKMKKLSGSFFGRIKTYDDAIVSEDGDAWTNTVKRYLYPDSDVSDQNLKAMAQYTKDLSENIAGQNSQELLVGSITFSAEKIKIERSG